MLYFAPTSLVNSDGNSLCEGSLSDFLSLLQVRTLEYIKHQAQQADMSHLSDTVQRLTLQSRTWTSPSTTSDKWWCKLKTHEEEEKKCLNVFLRDDALWIFILHFSTKCLQSLWTNIKKTILILVDWSYIKLFLFHNSLFYFSTIFKPKNNNWLNYHRTIITQSLKPFNLCSSLLFIVTVVEAH